LDGLHFDLLLEDEEFCRTWRLSSIPILDGPAVEALPISPHKLYWLDTEESSVSGGRGWAKRIVFGSFCGSLPSQTVDSVSIEIHSNSLTGCLILKNELCRIFSSA